MKVRMLVNISGVHDGEHWPAKGEEATVDKSTGEDLCRSGLAEEVEEKKAHKASAEETPKPEKATARKAEKRG